MPASVSQRIQYGATGQQLGSITDAEASASGGGAASGLVSVKPLSLKSGRARGDASRLAQGPFC